MEDGIAIKNKLSMLLPKRVLDQIEEMISDSYDKGQTDGYSKAHKIGSTIINILVKRIGGKVEISKEELGGTLDVEIERGGTEDGGIYFRVKD